MADWIQNKLTWLAERIWDRVIWLAERTWNGITWMAGCIWDGVTWVGKSFTVGFNYVTDVAVKFYGEYLNSKWKTDLMCCLTML